MINLSNKNCKIMKGKKTAQPESWRNGKRIDKYKTGEDYNHQFDNIRIVIGTLDNSNLKHNYFDIIILHNVHAFREKKTNKETINRENNFLKSIKRALKPNGKIFIADSIENPLRDRSIEENIFFFEEKGFGVIYDRYPGREWYILTLTILQNEKNR